MIRFNFVLISTLLLSFHGLLVQAQTLSGQSRDPEGWSTVWFDDFEGESLNRNLWNIEVNGDGGGNNELQYYCEEGVAVKDGNLVLTAKRKNYQGKNFISGRINSHKKVYFTHGKLEAKIKLPYTERGLWPAFWMLGNDIDTNEWPRCGEIDVFEMGNINGWLNGNNPKRYLNGALHWGYFVNGGYPNYGVFSNAPYDIQGDEYHLFTCIWDEKSIAMYLDLDRNPDVKPYFVMNVDGYDGDRPAGHYFHKPFHILFNLAVGGGFPQIFEANGITALENYEGASASMFVDWVRVSQPSGGNYTFEAPLIDNKDADYPPVPVAVHSAEQHDVLSILSGHYESSANPVLSNWDGQSTTGSIEYIKNVQGVNVPVFHARNFNYFGFELVNGTPSESNSIDISGRTHMHVDYYTPTGSKISFTPIAIGKERRSENYFDETPHYEDIVSGKWHSFDVALADFTNEWLEEQKAARVESEKDNYKKNTVKHIQQIKFAEGSGEEAYIANVYFYNLADADDDNNGDNGGNGGGNDGEQGEGCTYIDSVNTDTGSETKFNGNYTINVKTVDDNNVLITVTFSKEDTDRTGWVNPILWDESAGLVEKNMTLLDDGVYTCTLTGLSFGSTVKFRIKAIFAGMALTKQISYTVGQNCDDNSTSVENISGLPLAHIYPNPANDAWNVECNSQYGEITLWSLDGKFEGRYEICDGFAKVDASTFEPGIYLMRIATQKGAVTERVIKK